MTDKVFKLTYRTSAWILFCGALVVFAIFKYGAEKASIVALLIACAYLNAMFLPDPLRVFRRRDIKGFLIAIGALLANVVLLYLVDFNALIAVLVWLPAIAGVLAAKLLPE